MEAFSLLKYWKSSGGSGGGVISKLSATTPTAVLTSFNHEECDNDGGDDDDGHFFHLELPVNTDKDLQVEEEDERQKIESESVENELFFKGIDSSESAPLTEIEEILSSGTADKTFTLPVSLMKSATKLGVLMLGLKRSKSENSQDNKTSRNSSTTTSSKFLTVRLKMEEMKMPKMSVLKRTPSNVVKNTELLEDILVGAISDESNIEVKKHNNKKDRYLKLVRPLYVKVPKKSDCENVEVNSGKTSLNLRVMGKKHLGKSKSAVVHSMPRSSGGGSSKTSSSSKKIDDSLLQQQDGIQGAILHCKRSFNSSFSSEDGEDTMSVLMRSTSDPSYEKKFIIETAEVVVEEHE